MSESEVFAFTMVLLKSRSRSLFEIVVALFDHEGFLFFDDPFKDQVTLLSLSGIKDFNFLLFQYRNNTFSLSL